MTIRLTTAVLATLLSALPAAPVAARCTVTQALQVLQTPARCSAASCPAVTPRSGALAAADCRRSRTARMPMQRKPSVVLAWRLRTLRL